MMAAASAWDALAAEVDTAATGYDSVVSELTSAPWVGPASASMVSAVTPYVSWLSAVATQAEETADQARAAAAAYEAAFMMTVPPPVIAANRALLMALVATNFFGQNTPAIMATEAQYMEMWAQDAAAMYGYSASSTTASALTPFDPPPQTTTPDGTARQAAAVAQAAADPPAVPAQSFLTDLVTAILEALGLSPIAPNPDIMNPIFQTLDFLLRQIIGSNDTAALLIFFNRGPGSLLYQPAGMASFLMSIQQQFLNAPIMASGSETAEAAAVPGPVIVHALPGGLGYQAANFAPRSLSLRIGVGERIGGLSVPGSWGRSAGSAGLLDGFEVRASSANGSKMNGMFRGIPLAGMGGTHRGAAYQGVRYGFRYPVVTHPPSAG